MGIALCVRVVHLVTQQTQDVDRACHNSVASCKHRMYQAPPLGLSLLLTTFMRVWVYISHQELHAHTTTDSEST